MQKDQTRECCVAFSDNAMSDQALLVSRTLISGDTSISCDQMFPLVRMPPACETPFDQSLSILFGISDRSSA